MKTNTGSGSGASHEQVKEITDTKTEARKQKILWYYMKWYHRIDSARMRVALDTQNMRLLETKEDLKKEDAFARGDYDEAYNNLFIILQGLVKIEMQVKKFITSKYNIEVIA